MTKYTFLFAGRSGFAAAALAGLLVVQSDAVAQTMAGARSSEAAGDDSSILLEKFVVTGSALPVLEGESFQPVKFIEREAADLAGSGTVIELLRTMPDFFGNMSTEQRANGGSGNGGVNLRGLGGTLTLLDGHRTAGFDEINLIPMIAFQRFEVVKDGAGARYGADALTGVFNSILVPRFTGQKMEVYFGDTTEGGGETLRAGLLAGAASERTEIVVGAEYYHRGAIMSRDREVSADEDTRNQGGQNWRNNIVSGLTYARLPTSSAFSYWALPKGTVAGYSVANYVPQTTDMYFNAREFTPSTPEQENKSVYVRVNQKIVRGGVLDAYARILYANNTYESGVSPAAIQMALSTLSPHAPVGLNVYTPGSYFYFMRPGVLGARGRTHERDVYDFQFGLKGRLGANWSWDATYVYSWWYRDETQSNSVSAASLTASIISGKLNPFAPDTAQGVNPNNGLAYDNPAAFRAAAVSGKVDYDAGMRGGDARLSGVLFALPGGRVEVAGGFDYYRAEQSTVPDAFITAAAGTYAGFTATGFSASGYTSRGAFAEVMVPLFQRSQKVAGLRTLRFSASVRRSEKDIEGTVRDAAGVPQLREREFGETTPKFGLIYEPCGDVSLRSTYAEGFRTPGLSFQFAAPTTATQSLSDPLGFTTGTVSVTTQGNPDLQAERSKTWSTGVTFTPKKVRGLRVQVDFYDETVRGLVADGAQYFLNVNAAAQGAGFVRGNAATINPNAEFASRITRNAAGAVTAVASTPMNVSRREATGLDMSVIYRWPVDFAKLTTRADWNTALSWDLVTVQGLPSQNWLGRYVDTPTNAISPGSIPRNRGRFIQIAEKGAWSVVGAVNYVSHLEDDSARTTLKTFRYVSSWTTLDAQIGYRWKKAGLEVRLGVNNLTDQAAPFAAAAAGSASNISYDPTLHSDRGRFVYTQVRKAF